MSRLSSSVIIVSSPRAIDSDFTLADHLLTFAATNAETHVGLYQTVDTKHREKGRSNFEEELQRRKLHTLQPIESLSPLKKKWHCCQPVVP